MCERVSEKAMDVVQETFNNFDTDKDGEITAVELVEAMKRLKGDVSLQAAQKMIELYDKDESGTLTIDEFKTMIQTTFKYREIFNALDTDGSGKISQGELMQHLKTINVELSEEEVQCMMISIDQDGDGEIDLKEFTNYLKHLQDEEMAEQQQQH